MSESYEDEQKKLYQEIERDVLEGLGKNYTMEPATYAVAITWTNGNNMTLKQETLKARSLAEALGQSIINYFSNPDNDGSMTMYSVQKVN